MMIWYLVCHLVGVSSACTNPVIYGLLNLNIQQEYRNILLNISKIPQFWKPRPTQPETIELQMIDVWSKGVQLITRLDWSVKKTCREGKIGPICPERQELLSYWTIRYKAKIINVSKSVVKLQSSCDNVVIVQLQQKIFEIDLNIDKLR